MRLFKTLFACVPVAAFVAGCVQYPVGSSSVEHRQPALVSGVMPYDADWAADVAANGKLHLAYYDAKRRVHLLSSGMAAPLTPYHPDGSQRASSSLAVASHGEQAYVAFRDKEPDRDVFVGSFGGQGAGPLQPLGSETVPLARLKLVDRPNGVGVLWYGEPRVAERAGLYDVFYRELDASGSAVGKPQQLFEGIYPVMAQTGSGKLTAFSWYKSGGENRIVARTKMPGEDFAGEQLVAVAAPLTPMFDAVADGERALVFWHAQYGATLSEFRFEGAYSDDGKDWKRFHVKGLDGWDVESGSVAADGAGNVAVAVAVVTPGEFRKLKTKVLLVVSHDGGATWSDPIQVRDDPLQVEKNYSHAQAPKVAFLGKGQLFVAWQDWRSLRSAVHFKYSEDAGASWAVSDARLTPVDVLQERLSTFNKSLFVRNGRVHLVAEQLTDDAMLQKRLVERVFTSEDLKRFPVKSSTPSTGSVERLQQRVLAYWAAMGKRDYEAAYGMMEPYFRARVRYDIYREKLGRIEYSQPSIKYAEVYGPLGMGVTTVTVEVKPIMVQRKSMKLDPQEREIPTRWLWMDGDWYLEFNSEAEDIRYTPF